MSDGNGIAIRPAGGSFRPVQHVSRAFNSTEAAGKSPHGAVIWTVLRGNQHFAIDSQAVVGRSSAQPRGGPEFHKIGELKPLHLSLDVKTEVLALLRVTRRAGVCQCGCCFAIYARFAGDTSLAIRFHEMLGTHGWCSEWHRGWGKLEHRNGMSDMLWSPRCRIPNQRNSLRRRLEALLCLIKETDALRPSLGRKGGSLSLAPVSSVGASNIDGLLQSSLLLFNLRKGG